jgi:hypothetical protein
VEAREDEEGELIVALHKVAFTLTAVAMVKADSPEEALQKSQALQGKIMLLDPSHDLVFAGPLAARDRPELSVSPTVTVIAVDDEADMVHKS